MRPSGFTTDDKPVFGVFRLIDTHGIPLWLVLDYMGDKARVDWREFVLSALKAGWSRRHLLASIEEALFDHPHRREVVRRVLSLTTNAAMA